MQQPQTPLPPHSTHMFTRNLESARYVGEKQGKTNLVPNLYIQFKGYIPTQKTSPSTSSPVTPHPSTLPSYGSYFEDPI